MIKIKSHVWAWLINKFSGIAPVNPVQPLNVSYKEITISKGDTLWDISQKYKNDDESIKDYVNKIMEFNNMKSDRINAGQKLIVIINS